MAFLPAYDRRTGRKLPHFVPEHWFDDPVLGQNVRRTPRNAAAKVKVDAKISDAKKSLRAAGQVESDE